MAGPVQAPCDLTELPPDMCAHCRGLDLPTRLKAERVILAKYDGGCPGCGGPIREGDSIGLVDREWVCSGCFS